jgi:putative tryptophan/tyrosine transport system substrate-binding protein
MNRRVVIAGLLLSAAIRPLYAQQSDKVYRIAIVSPSTPVIEINETNSIYGPLLEELRRLGYVEGQNLVIDRYSGEGRSEHYREVIRDVVRSNPDAVFTTQGQLVMEFKAQTETVPCVCGMIDPVGFGVVPSLARPGGNITGIDADAGLQTWGKRLGLLKEAVPTLSRVGLLIVPNALGQRGVAVLKDAADKAKLALVDSPLMNPFDEEAYRRAIASLVQAGAEAVYVGDQYENWTNRRVIVELAEKYRLATIFAYGVQDSVQIGGLMTYSPDWLDQFRQGARQIDQILKGTKPGDIPFYQARKYSLAINLKTAKTLGIEIPNSILAQADEVIE